MSVIVINAFRVSSGGGGDGYPTALVASGGLVGNGTYTRTGGTSGGRPVFEYSGIQILYSSPGWIFFDGMDIFYTNNTDDPTATYTANSGFEPAPTVTAA